MTESSSDPVAQVDECLRALHRVVENARTELLDVRRRQSELAGMEATLLMAIEARSRRIDALLDERLRAAARYPTAVDTSPPEDAARGGASAPTHVRPGRPIPSGGRLRAAPW